MGCCHLGRRAYERANEARAESQLEIKLVIARVYDMYMYEVLDILGE